MIAFLFPGQGSLRPGMGAPWADTPSWEIVGRLSAVLGRDLAELLLKADAQTLEATRNAQAATFALSLVALDRVHQQGIEPIAVAGHSLGEYTALVTAGVLSVEVAMTLVCERGEAMQLAADAQPGTMAAVLGTDPETVALACDQVGGVWVANDNAPGQVVVAGTREGIDALDAVVKAKGASRVMALAVGGGFHSPLMAPAQTRLDAALQTATFRAASISVVTNVDASAHTDTDWRALLSAQLCRPVLWRASLATLAGLGVTTFVEIGPGDALTGMVKRTVDSATRHSVSTPETADALVRMSAT